MFAPVCFMLLFSTCGKKAFSSQLRLLHMRECAWRDIEARKIPCTQSGPREHSTAKGLYTPSPRRSQGGKKARVAFQGKHILGLEFHSCVEYTFLECCFQMIVLLRFGDHHQSLNILAHYMLLFSACDKMAFKTYQAAAHKRTLLD